MPPSSGMLVSGAKPSIARRAMLVALVACTGCGSIPEGVLACSSDGQCPSGWSCRANGRCYESPGGDAGMDVDGGQDTDAGPTDGGECPTRTETCDGNDEDC